MDTVETYERCARTVQEKLDEVIPLGYIGGFETWRSFAREHTALLHAAKGWVDGFEPRKSKGLALTGGNGSGKTHLACGILKAALNRAAQDLIDREYFYFGDLPKSFVFQHLPTLFFDIKETFRKGYEGPTSGEIISRLKDSQLLVLDEFGTQDYKEYDAGLLLLILDAACREKRPTIIITSNYTRTELLLKIGENGKRIMSRLEELCDPKGLGPFPKMDARQAKKGAG